MFAENRRLERKMGMLDTISKLYNVKNTIDLSIWEKENKFLEGTGSIILDHDNKIAYACRSERTAEIVFEDFCTKMNFKSILFDAVDQNKHPIYHSNVMLSIGEKVAVICIESITDNNQRSIVLNSLKDTQKEILEISLEQMKHFCGNVIEVFNLENEKCLIMSDDAKQSFTTQQKNILKKHCKLVSSPLQIIEHTGGGSARCMIAEIF